MKKLEGGLSRVGSWAHETSWLTSLIWRQKLRRDNNGLVSKGRHPKKKTADLVKMALLGGRGSEKLLNFHHLQMMENMEGGVSE